MLQTVLNFGHWVFEFVSCFDIRISNLSLFLEKRACSEKIAILVAGSLDNIFYLQSLRHIGIIDPQRIGHADGQ